LSVAAAFSNVLFGASCCLNHLINSPVSMLWQMLFAEQLRQLVEHIASLIKPQFLEYNCFSQDTGSAIVVVVDCLFLFVFHRLHILLLAKVQLSLGLFSDAGELFLSSLQTVFYLSTIG
jgi:hypothetical protein